MKLVLYEHTQKKGNKKILCSRVEYEYEATLQVSNSFLKNFATIVQKTSKDRQTDRYIDRWRFSKTESSGFLWYETNNKSVLTLCYRGL